MVDAILAELEAVAVVEVEYNLALWDKGACCSLLAACAPNLMQR